MAAGANCLRRWRRRRCSPAMVQLGWLLAVVVELGGGLAILIGLFTRPVGLVLAIWCVVTALIAPYEFRRPQSGNRFLEKHGDDGRVSLRRRVRRPRLESRRMVVAPRRRDSSRLNLTPGQRADRAREARSIIGSVAARGAPPTQACPRANLHRPRAAADCRRSRRDTSLRRPARAAPNARG
jgi:hypothetical protein